MTTIVTATANLIGTSSEYDDSPLVTRLGGPTKAYAMFPWLNASIVALNGLVEWSETHTLSSTQLDHAAELDTLIVNCWLTADCLGADYGNVARMPDVVATASSTYGPCIPSNVIDGDLTGATAWVATTYGLPAWLELDFNTPRSFSKVNLYSVQDNYTAPSEPTDTMTFTNYGLSSFVVEAWDGSSWVTLSTVTGNDLVKKTVEFDQTTADKIRITVNSIPDNWARIAALEVLVV